MNYPFKVLPRNPSEVQVRTLTNMEWIRTPDIQAFVCSRPSGQPRTDSLKMKMTRCHSKSLHNSLARSHCSLCWCHLPMMLALMFLSTNYPFRILPRNTNEVQVRTFTFHSGLAEVDLVLCPDHCIPKLSCYTQGDHGREQNSRFPSLIASRLDRASQPFLPQGPPNINNNQT